MVRHILSAVVAATLVLAAGAVSAQQIDFGSEANRVWWNGVTPNELQELAVEAGATYTSVSDDGTVVISRLEWPDIGAVQAWQGTCSWTNGVAGRDDNCAELVLIHETSPPADIELFRDNAPLWLASTVGDDGKFRLFRYDTYAFGTTRGRVLADLLLFQRYVGKALDLIEEIEQMDPYL